jgi:S-adenosylmethionine:tRNA ribosyltransferase-isomerase
MFTSDFDFELPKGLIAQIPAAKRDDSRLLVLDRVSGKIEHQIFPRLLEFLRPGDVLVLNDSRVIRARLRGTTPQTGRKFEILLVEENSKNDWWTMMRPGKHARVGTQINLCDNFAAALGVSAEVIEKNKEGHCRLRFAQSQNIFGLLDQLGEVPLPPYIERNNCAEDSDRYQTIFARTPGSIAAPTAGLHFTGTMLDQIRALGVQVDFVTLHVGVATFAPVKSDLIEAHPMHEERFSVSEKTLQRITEAKRTGRRVIAVGTTTVRVLETIADSLRNSATGNSILVQVPHESIEGRTRIFIHPPYRFEIVDALLTNFHLPRSTLLMLVSAFAAPNETNGRKMILNAYAEAVRERYRFFSYGDAMLIL